MHSVDVTHKVCCIHDAILNRMGAIQGEFQDLLLFLSTLLLNHLLLLAEKCFGLMKLYTRLHEQTMQLYRSN